MEAPKQKKPKRKRDEMEKTQSATTTQPFEEENPVVVETRQEEGENEVDDKEVEGQQQNDELEVEPQIMEIAYTK